MIHGTKRVHKQKTEQQVKEENQLLEKVNSKLSEFFKIPRNNVDVTMIPKYLEFIALLMQLVSDMPTIFNCRRQMVQKSINAENLPQMIDLLSKEIKLTTKLIQSDPKSYTIWSYRQWIIKILFKINDKVIKADKELVSMLLIKDEKNFHAWNYRNWLNSIQFDIEEELKFTEDKIKMNPFNFSPYHFRSKYIPLKYAQTLQKQADASIKQEIMIFGMPKDFLLEELQKVKTAIFINPNQQAPWLYYNWILSQLVPAFVVSKQTEQQVIILVFNMKVGSFAQLIDQPNQELKGASGNMSDVWQICKPIQGTTVISNLENYKLVKTESTSKLFLGEVYNKQWVQENIISLLQSGITFIDEVIESEEEKICRFAHLQKTSIYKLLLQCGTSQNIFEQYVKQSVQSLNIIKNEAKTNKYISKQISYWQRLSRKELTKAQQKLMRMRE